MFKAAVNMLNCGQSHQICEDRSDSRPISSTNADFLDTYGQLRPTAIVDYLRDP